MENKIDNTFKNDKNISLSDMAKKLNIPTFEVLKNSEKVKEYDLKNIDSLFNILRNWEKVLMIVMTPNFILEIQDKFPNGFYSHGFLNLHDTNSSIGGHLSVKDIRYIFLVDDIMFGRKSCSIKFFSENKEEIFSIYVPRDKNKELIENCLKDFYNLMK